MDGDVEQRSDRNVVESPCEPDEYFGGLCQFFDVPGPEEMAGKGGDDGRCQHYRYTSAQVMIVCFNTVEQRHKAHYDGL